METELLNYRARRVHKVVSKDHTRVMQLGNGQLLATVPRELSRWKNISKGTLLKWSDGGQNRIIIEITKEEPE